MTCREKLKLEHPTCVDDRNCGGCYGCPSEYGYLGIPEYCPHHSDTNACTKCWDREIPDNDITPPTGFVIFNDGHKEDMTSVEVFDNEVLFRTKWYAYKCEKYSGSACRFYVLCYRVEDHADFYEEIDTIYGIEYKLGDGTTFRYEVPRNREIPEDEDDSIEGKFTIATPRVETEDTLPLSPEAKTELAEAIESAIKDSGDRTEFSTGAVRDMHEGKGDMASVPWEAILRLSKHYENGAKKYERWNFRKGIPVSSFIDSAVRHLAKYQCGCDDEDHLAAAAFNVLGAMLMENTMPEMQDLPLRKGKNTFDYFEKKDVN